MLNTVLEERFAMANLVRTANLEIEKAKSISDKRAEALKIKENEFLQTSKFLTETNETLRTLLSNNPTFSENNTLVTIVNRMGDYSSSGSSFKLDEPYKLLGEIIGSGSDWNRVSSIVR